jgi:epoxyqueuosine reductase
MVRDPATLTRRIREEAGRLGFFKVGVARTGPLPDAGRFDEWLASGMHGEMAYMARQAPKRRDPGKVLEGARTILALALNYHTPEALTDDPLRGRISRYAAGGDYHRVVGERLAALCRFVEAEEPEAATLWYVDTGPVMEKVWAAASSLGWMGKHTNLIARGEGSWFFIGVVLLDLDLQYDEPERDHCGTCTRCITACPTGAIVAPYVVDARLCISYLTIELRGAIPRRLRPLIGNRIYGCDDCQEVCPWNRFAVPTPAPELRPRAENLMPELEGLVDLTPEEFARRYRDSPIRRVRRDGLVRNVVVALGNSGRPEAVPALARALADRSALVRAHAAWALGRLGTPAASGALEAAARIESEPSVLEEIGAARAFIESK